ncbi:methylmalonyl-CoA epimerase [Longibacter salinarum]|uniref:Methylmalonyl-CoA epimerase n=1 Tax=Longibacter salinarum TaxID=1850348 RepID=A0A2A8D1R1_9BACT|nr:methylmalonyl-CoA epimerase [Longibacter salinarum]PEN14856.1 methylmalonyl-CoA epimerase [Longibacter salinarum]
MPQLEHIGIAVDDADAVRSLYQDLLDVLPYKVESVASQHVQTHFINAGTAKLELLESTNEDGPIAGYLKKRGEGLHHLAFQVDDVDATFERLQDAGYTPLGDEPTPGADGKRIFFLHPKQTHGVLVEFCGSAPIRPEPHMIDAGDHELAVYTSGSDHQPPLLLLHGAAGCTSLETAPLMRKLETQFQVIALDFRGHGSSTASTDPISFDAYAEDVEIVMDTLELQQADLFGFSMGGNVALGFAQQHPDRVGRVAAHGANVTWSQDIVASMQARLDADLLTKQNARLTEHLSAHHLDWRALFDHMQEWVATLPEQTPRMKQMAEAVDRPALISCVDQDDLFPLSATLALHNLLPDARLEVLRGSHHALPLAPLDRLCTTLSSWFTD